MNTLLSYVTCHSEIIFKFDLTTFSSLRPLHVQLLHHPWPLFSCSLCFHPTYLLSTLATLSLKLAATISLPEWHCRPLSNSLLHPPLYPLPDSLQPTDWPHLPSLQPCWLNPDLTEPQLDIAGESSATICCSVMSTEHGPPEHCSQFDGSQKQFPSWR